MSSLWKTINPTDSVDRFRSCAVIYEETWGEKVSGHVFESVKQCLQFTICLQGFSLAVRWVVHVYACGRVNAEVRQRDETHGYIAWVSSIPIEWCRDRTARIWSKYEATDVSVDIPKAVICSPMRVQSVVAKVVASNERGDRGGCVANFADETQSWTECVPTKLEIARYPLRALFCAVVP